MIGTISKVYLDKKQVIAMNIIVIKPTNKLGVSLVVVRAIGR